MNQSDQRLTADLVADLEAVCKQLEMARLMLTDAMLAPKASDSRKKARDARNTLGSALQTLALALDAGRLLRRRAAD